MLGWLILFALMVILSSTLMFLGDAGVASAKIASSVFAVLFLIGVLTRAARDRAW